MMDFLFHRHRPHRTWHDFMIVAEFGKENLPEGIKPVRSEGWLAVCKCMKLFIIHDKDRHFREKWTELVL